MLLGDFIKELKHSSIKIVLFYSRDTRVSIFSDTLCVLKNNIYYQNKWIKWRITNVFPFYEKEFKNALNIEIEP